MNHKSPAFQKIVVICGGRAREREISLTSGKAVARALQEEGYEVLILDPSDKNFIHELISLKPDAAYLALHGRGGEDGIIQGFLETAQIPYTGSSVFSSVICFDKILTKKILGIEKILSPRYWIFNPKEKSISEWILNHTIDYPVIVKPNKEGSTLGIHRVYQPSELEPALKDATSFGGEILIEELIEGREITVAIDEEHVYPIIEIIPHSGFYDFQSKYTKGSTEYDIPAKISKNLENDINRVTRKIYDVLKCEGAVRVDYIIKEDQFYCLEVNTIPGMTETSLLPKAALEVGISFSSLCKAILEKASLKFHD